MAEQDPQAVAKAAETIAVVGLSRDPAKPSRKIASFLKKHGYRVIPVNPTEEEVLGERAYDTVDQIPEKVDVVNVFLRSEKTPQIAEDAVRAGAKVLWLQQGITNPQARRIAQEGGFGYIEDECIYHSVNESLQKG
jgi:predicted CoA-binding protein